MAEVEVERERLGRDDGGRVEDAPRHATRRGRLSRHHQPRPRWRCNAQRRSLHALNYDHELLSILRPRPCPQPLATAVYAYVEGPRRSPAST